MAGRPAGEMEGRPSRWRHLSAREFADHHWQLQQASGDLSRTAAIVEELAGAAFARSVTEGSRRAAMRTRITPHLLSLIDWQDPEHDPIRRQLLPMVEELEPEHPYVTWDPLAERRDSPVPGIVHRYADRALFLVLDACPVYCTFCTRSYLVGPPTSAPKDSMPINSQRWAAGIEYLKGATRVKDVILSGGDIWLLPPRYLGQLVTALAEIPHVRRIRLGSRGLGALPTMVTNDDEWFATVAACAELLVSREKRLMLHSHFNHANEVSAETQAAVRRLRQLPIELRNHTVLLAGVNDDPVTAVELFSALSDTGIAPYYAFHPDLVPRSEHLRLPLSASIELEQAVAGRISGYDLPRFVIDLPGGGGKRGPWSFDTYDRATGISVYSGSSVRSGRFVHVDPLRSLDPAVVERWQRGEVEVPPLAGGEAFSSSVSRFAPVEG